LKPLPSASILAAALVLGLASWAQAQPAPGNGAGNAPANAPGSSEPPRHGPPPEAMAACKGKAVGDSCSFVGRRGETLTGSCFTPPAMPQAAGNGNGQNRPVACRPPHPPGEHGGPGDMPPQR